MFNSGFFYYSTSGVEQLFFLLHRLVRISESPLGASFVIKQIQTDNGKEFSDQFTWYLDDLGIEHRKTNFTRQRKMVK